MNRSRDLLVLVCAVAIAAGIGASSAMADLPAPNHALFFGYYHVASPRYGQQFDVDDYYSFEPTVWWVDAQGVWGYKTIINHDQVYAVQHGSFDYWPEVLSFTNGYVSECRDTNEEHTPGGGDPHLIWEALWVARQVETMERAAIDGKDIYWLARLPNLGITGALAKIICAIRDHDLAHPEAQIWPRVKYIDLADKPPWSTSQINGFTQTMMTKLAQYGLPLGDRLIGISTNEGNFAAALASNLDFVSIQAYVDAPPTAQQGDVQQWSDVLEATLDDLIGQATGNGKKSFLVLQGSDCGGCWHDADTMAELQRVAYRRAALDVNVIGLTIYTWAAGGPTDPGDLCPCGEAPAAFQWGSRPMGPQDLAPYARPELQAAHQEIYQAITGGPPVLGPVTNFVATPGSEQVNLSWHNPSDAEFTGAMIRYKTTSSPSSVTDGTLLIDKPGSPDTDDTYLHTGLTNGITYYYAAFAHDGVPNYALAATANAQPNLPGVCFFDAFAYPDGNLGGNGGWSGAYPPIAVSAETVRITGGTPEYNTARSVSCSGSGGLINVRVLVKGTTGNSNMWGLWINDASGNNLARWYGASMGARPRIGGSHTLVLNPVSLTGDWDTLDVNIDTNTNESEFFFNGTSLGTLDHTGAGDTVGLLTWQRLDNSNADGNMIYFDDLSMGNVDTTPPGTVTNFEAASGDGQIALSWTNPADPDFAGTKMLYKTTGYPTSETDGTVVYTGSGTNCVHSGLTNGTRCYYSAFTYDAFPNYSAAANATAVPAADATIPVARGLADGQVRALRGNVVSAVFTGCFYIQDPLGPWGMRVSGASASRGQEVDVVGTMAGQGAEWYIECTGDDVTVTDEGPITIYPAGIGNEVLGGAGLDSYALGVYGGWGPYNIGLLVRVWGKVTQRDHSLQHFYIDDGSQVSDGTQTEVSEGVFEPSVGVRIKADPTSYPTGSYVVVTGISSCFEDGSDLKRQLLPRTDGIQLLGP